MKNWDTLEADVDMIISKHYTPGRTASIDKVVLHHNAGNLTVEGCYNVWQSREASAHYQVEENGRIGQLVNDWDTAWHAGDANPSSIGIEHANNAFGSNDGRGWTISEATLDNGAHLVAAICRHYNLGRPEWGRNVFGHRDFMGTSCPGEIAMAQNGDYMLRAQFYYDNWGGTNSPAPVQAAAAPAKPELPANFPLPYPLPGGHFFGSISGGEDSHGGYYHTEKPWIRSIQQALVILGCVAGVTDPNSAWCDGVWESPTTEAMAEFQRRYRPDSTDRWGEAWADDLQTMREQFA